jgi:hypothetical protein
MAHRYQFDANTRWVLREDARLSNAVIADLENVVGDYKERRDRRPSDATRKKVRLQLARARRTLARCRRDLEALPARIRFNLHLRVGRDLRYLPDVLEAYRPGLTVPRKRPPDTIRQQLEFAVGHMLHRHHIKLTTYIDGQLALTLTAPSHGIGFTS